MKLTKNQKNLAQFHTNDDISEKHYDRYDYYEERKEVVTLWCKKLDSLR